MIIVKKFLKLRNQDYVGNVELDLFRITFNLDNQAVIEKNLFLTQEEKLGSVFVF